MSASTTTARGRSISNPAAQDDAHYLAGGARVSRRQALLVPTRTRGELVPTRAAEEGWTPTVPELSCTFSGCPAVVALRPYEVGAAQQLLVTLSQTNAASRPAPGGASWVQPFRLLGQEHRLPVLRSGTLPSTTSRRAPPVPEPRLAPPYPSHDAGQERTPRGGGGAARPRDAVPPPPPAPSFFRSLLPSWGGH